MRENQLQGGGASYSSQLCRDSDQIPQRSEMMRCANIYLHYALNLWATRWRRHAADMIIVRYADDVIIGFEHHGPTASRRSVRIVPVRADPVAVGVVTAAAAVARFDKTARPTT